MDLIDRKQAIDSICVNICSKSHDNCGFWKKDFEYCPACRFAFLVGNTLSAEKTGRWLPAQDYTNGNEDIECSNCGEWFKSIELCGRMGEPNYCPVCGARMEG